MNWDRWKAFGIGAIFGVYLSGFLWLVAFVLRFTEAITP